LDEGGALQLLKRLKTKKSNNKKGEVGWAKEAAIAEAIAL